MASSKYVINPFSNNAFDSIGTGSGQILVSDNDTTTGYLNGKLVIGTYTTLTENNDGGNETLTIDVDLEAINTGLFIDESLSTGLLSGNGMTDGGSGTVDLAAGVALLRATNSDTAPLIKYSFGSVTGLALTDQALNYIYLEYNGGTPQIVATVTQRNTDYNTNVYLGSAFRDGTVVHINAETEAYIASGIRRLIYRFNETAPFQRATGGILSESGTLNIAISAGVFWDGLKRFETDAFDSSTADTFVYNYRDGVGGWTEVAASSAIDELQYDDGSGTLATLSGSQYGVHWVYLEHDSEIYVLYGQDDYPNIAAAQDSAAPETIPPHMVEHAKLIGRVIIRKGETTFTEINTVFEDEFSIAPVTDHGNLAGLGDDDHLQYHTDARGDARYLKLDLSNDPLVGTLDITGTLNVTATITVGNLAMNANSLYATDGGHVYIIPGIGQDVILGDGAGIHVDSMDGITGVSYIEVDNLRMDGNSIISTDTNGNITLTPNGIGNVDIGNFQFDADQTVGAGQDNYVLTYDNGTGLISLEAAAAGATDHGALTGLSDDDHPQYFRLDQTSNQSLSNVPTATVATTDKVVVLDADDSDLVKTVTAQSIADLASGGTVIEATVGQITFHLGDDSSAIGVGTRMRLVAPYDMGLRRWYIQESAGVPVSGSMVCDVKRGTTYGAATSLMGTELPTLVSQSENSDLDLTTGTTAIAAGDYLWVNVDSNTGVKQVEVVLVGDVAITDGVITWNIGDYAGSVIQPNTRMRLVCPWDIVVSGWRIWESGPNTTSGSIVCDIRRGTTYGASTSLAGSEKPTLSSASENSDLSLSSWTTSISKGDYLWINVDSASVLKQVAVSIIGSKA